MIVSNLGCPHGYVGALLSCPFCTGIGGNAPSSLCPHGYIRAFCSGCDGSAVTTTTTDSTSDITWYISPTGDSGLRTYKCPTCPTEWWAYDYCPNCNLNPASAPESAEGENPLSLIDERQVEVLDDFRNARDVAARHAQSKVDRATLMKIQAEALIAESRELVAELNEDTPYPNKSGADIGPIPGAGGARR